MWAYRNRFPIEYPLNIVTLGEGATPVTRLRNGVLIKHEQLNPTGSFKDRFASCGISWMKEHGRTEILATSSGNTGAALAAYSAQSGIRCRIFVLETTPASKIRQMLVYGADLVRVRGFGTDPQCTQKVMEELRKKAQTDGASLLISAFAYSPEGMAGVKSISYELVKQVEAISDIFIPVGGGGLLTAVYQGFLDLVEAGEIDRVPRIHAVQPKGCATICEPLEKGELQARPVHCTSAISGLQVASVIDGDLALSAVKSTQGTGQSVTDAEIYHAQQELIGQGVFCEPAGAAAYAGFKRALSLKQVVSRQGVVCLVTGHGSKDTESIDRLVAGKEVPLRSLEDFLS